MTFLKIVNIYRAMHVSLIQNDSEKCPERNESYEQSPEKNESYEQSPEKTKNNGEHKRPYQHFSHFRHIY